MTPHIFPPALGAERTGRAFAAAIPPIVPRAAFAEIAGVGVFADQVDQPCPTELMRKVPGRGLVEPIGGVCNSNCVAMPGERGLQRLDGLVAAIGIAGIVGLAHAADDRGCRAGRPARLRS